MAAVLILVMYLFIALLTSTAFYNIATMSRNYHQYQPDHRQSRRGDESPQPASSYPVSRSPSNSRSPLAPVRDVRDINNDRQYPQRNEGCELFPSHRDTNGDNRPRHPRTDRPGSGDYNPTHYAGPPRGANAVPVGRRIEELRNGAESGPADPSGPSQNLNRYAPGPQRPRSGTGTKRSSDGSSDRASKSSRTERTANLTRLKKGDPGDPFRVTRDNCKPGTIIQALLYEEAMDESLLARARNGANNSAITGLFKLGLDGEDDWWIRKNRPWIITAVYADSYTCIPLHTHNGDGLARKLNIPGLVGEFVRVKEHTPDVMSVASDNPGSQTDLYVDVLYGDFKLHAESVAWLTYTMSRRFAGRANVVGRLRHSSVEVLMEHLRHFAPHRQPLARNTWRPTDRPSNPEVHGHDRLSETVGDAY